MLKVHGRANLKKKQSNQYEPFETKNTEKKKNQRNKTAS